MVKGIVVGIFDFIKQKTNYKSVFCGLDNSGKSTIITFLQKGRFVEHTPTMGKKKEELEIDGARITIFDMGGQTDFRDMWLGEVDTAKCVVFIIDKADPDRFEEARSEFGKLLPVIEKNSIKLLILANKHDLKNAVPLGKIIKAFDLMNLDNFEIMEISAKTGYGLADAFAKLYSLLTGQTLTREVLARAISICNKEGVPIITQNVSKDDVNRTGLEGGFIAAIKYFQESNENEIIRYKSESNGTFIVVKSTNFIGSLLWTDKLKVSIEQSESVLKDLLKHLEITSNSKDKEDVAFHVKQYTTNIL